jgi:hypothetical protein
VAADAIFSNGGDTVKADVTSFVELSSSDSDVVAVSETSQLPTVYGRSHGVVEISAISAVRTVRGGDVRVCMGVWVVDAYYNGS